MSADGLDGAEHAGKTAGESFAFADAPPEADADAIARLAKLPPLEYDRVREAEAKRMGCRVGTLDAAVAAARPKPEAATGKFLTLHDPESWPEPVLLAELLEAIEAAIRRHVILPASAAVLIGLWIAHTWVAERFEHTPRLAVTSPTKRCGKSTLIELLRLLCRRPLKADSISAAGTFRLVEALHPLTLLLDEADSFLHENEELRGVLNSGFERSGASIRLVEVNDEWRPAAFHTFCAMALACIGRLHGTLEDRAIPVRMARKTAAETVVRLREAGGRAGLDILARKLCRWAANDGAKVGTDPAIPAALNDREGDLSVPLLAIADTAGPEWGRRARAALLDVFGLRTAEGEDAERSVLLLWDIRALFFGISAARMTSADLCRHLGEMEERPWPEWRQGKPMTAPQLAVVLRPFGIRPVKLRLAGERPVQGYHREAFADAWARYLPNSPFPSKTGSGDPEHRNNVEADYDLPKLATGTPGTVFRPGTGENRSLNQQCSGVPDPAPGAWGKGEQEPQEVAL